MNSVSAASRSCVASLKSVHDIGDETEFIDPIAEARKAR